MTALIVSAHFSIPAIVAAAGDRAGMRFLEFKLSLDEVERIVI